MRAFMVPQAAAEEAPICDSGRFKEKSSMQDAFRRAV